MSEHELGRYTGKLILEPLQGGQQLKTVLDFGFLDADGKHWPVPPGTSVDGASIPKALPLLWGGLWHGKYREAAVVHDYHCAARSADWQSVHRMFYRAMLASGVSEPRAKLVYAGVYFAGPRWENRVAEPVRLSRPQGGPKQLLEIYCTLSAVTPSRLRSARQSSARGRLPLTRSHLRTNRLTGTPRSSSSWIGSLIWWKKMPLPCEILKRPLTTL